MTGYKSQLTEKASNIFNQLSPKPFIAKLLDKLKWRKRRRSNRRGDETEGALQLEERLERGEVGEEAHILGGDDSEDEDSNRPLLNEEGGGGGEGRAGSRRSRANSLPPGYDEATKEDSPEPDSRPN